MAKRQQEEIYGYVDLTDHMRQWIKKKVMEGEVKLALGWRVIPAHHRDNPTKMMIMHGYPDTEESHLYWFDNPEKRDRTGMTILREPLPIKSKRDKEYFEEENARMRQKHGFYRYQIFQSRRGFIQEYVPETDFIPSSGKYANAGIREEIAAEIGSEEHKVTVPVKKRSKTETRLVGAQ